MMEPRFPGLMPYARRFRCWALVLSLAAGVPLVCPASSQAQAIAAPDSMRIVLLRLELRHFDEVQVAAGGAKILAHGPVISSDGFGYKSDPGHWSDMHTWTPQQERVIPWAEVQSIHARRGAGRGGVALGALAGLAIGLVIEMADVLDHPFSASKPSGAPIILGIAGGAVLGALVDHPGPWEPVYP